MLSVVPLFINWKISSYPTCYNYPNQHIISNHIVSRSKAVLTFGPISVLPEYQRMGYSKILIEHSFAKAIELGYDAVVIFGDPDNYVSRGFKSCIKYNVCLDGDIFPTALLVKELRDGVLDGRKWYYHESSASELLNDEEKFNLIDSKFPPKIKEWKPSQEAFFSQSHSVVRQ